MDPKRTINKNIIRKKHLNTDRSINPCNNWNAAGDVYGGKHAAAWTKFYKK